MADSEPATTSTAIATPADHEAAGDVVVCDQDDNGMNKLRAVCRACGCKVLPVSTGAWETDVSFDLPCRKISDGSETLTEFWSVGDVFAFDNIGVTRAGDGSEQRFLTCADCELEPIGFVNADTNTYYLAANRVSYV